MLRHLVFFKFNPDADESEILDLERSLKALDGVIPEIRGFEVGRDIVKSERSFDLALFSTFDDLEAMQRYQVHPEHQDVVAKVRRLCEKVVAVDYEI
jgi:hypothetical protein